MVGGDLLFFRHGYLRAVGRRRALRGKQVAEHSLILSEQGSPRTATTSRGGQVETPENTGDPASQLTSWMSFAVTPG